MKARPPSPLTGATLSAFLEVEQPRFQACLVAEASDAGVTVELTVAQRLSVKLSAPSLSDAGSACLEAVGPTLGLSTAQPGVSASIAIEPPSGAEATANVPEAAVLRAAVTSSCECFEALSVNAPPQLVLHHLPRAPVDVVTASDPIAARLERCLEARLASIPGSEIELTVDLPLISSVALHESPDAASDVVTAQREAMARRARAEFGLLLTQHNTLTRQLDAMATPLKRKPTPALQRQRKAACTTLFGVEDALVGVRARVKAPGPEPEPHPLCAGIRREAADE